MPLVTLTLKRERPAPERRAIADAVHAALVESIGIRPTTASRSSRTTSTM